MSGLTDAIRLGADIVFMADDSEFIALNVKKGRLADNTRSTAFGYCTALRTTYGDLNGKEVLVIGSGRVGSSAICWLIAHGALVSLIGDR